MVAITTGKCIAYIATWIAGNVHVQVNETDTQQLLENAERFGRLVGSHIKQAETSEIVVTNSNIGKN